MSHHLKHDVETVEGDGFEAKVHQSDEGWHAKVRIQDDKGVRGRVLQFFAGTAQELADRIGALSSHLVSAQNKVLELAAEPPEDPPEPEPITSADL